MSKIENLWQTSSEHSEVQWASLWVLPGEVGSVSFWPFTANEVIARLNEWLACLGANFRFIPDPLVSSGHYARMDMRDHTQAVALTMLGRMAAQTLLDESR